MRRALAIAAFVFFAPLDANAVCGKEADAITVPSMLVKAPRNVRPRVTTNATDLRLITAPPEGKTIPTTLRVSRSGEVTTIEIVPDDPLPANSRFEIVSGKRILSVLQTDDRLDTSPPTWVGIRTHNAVGDWPSTKKRKGPIQLLPECLGPGIAFRTSYAATDEKTDWEQLRYGIWMAPDPKSAIDYSVPPLAYLKGEISWKRDGGKEIAIGFGLSEVNSDFSVPLDAVKVKYGLKAIDLAGNQSAPSEVVVTSPN